MKYLKKVSSVFAALVLSSSAIAEVKVIVHPLNATDFNPQLISNLFLGKTRSFSDGSKASPMTLEEDHEVTAEFNRNALKKRGSQLKAYWSKLVFTGKGTPPEEVDNESDMLRKVKSDPKAIGFVSGSTPTDGVRVIATY